MLIKANQQVGFGGEITYQVLDDNGLVVNESAQPFHNEVLQLFWDRLNDKIQWAIGRIHCKVGSSADANVFANSTLRQQLTLNGGGWPFQNISSNDIIRHESIPSESVEIATYRWTFTFTVGQLVGDVNEIGFDFVISANATVSNQVTTRVVGFPTINLTASQQLIVTYVFKSYLVNNKTTLSFPATIFGSTVPTTVDIYRTVVSSHVFGDNGVSARGITSYSLAGYKSTTAGYSSIPAGLQDTASGLNTLNYADNDPRVPADYKWGAQFMIPITRGNFATGLHAIRSTWFSVTFDPPIPKDQDSEFRFGLAIKFTPLSGDKLTAVTTTPVSQSVPVVNLTVDPTTLELTDLAGNFSLQDPRNYLSGFLFGIPAIMVPWSKLPLANHNALRLVSNKNFKITRPMSYEFIVFSCPVTSATVGLTTLSGYEILGTQTQHNWWEFGWTSAGYQFDREFPTSLNEFGIPQSVTDSQGRWRRVVLHSFVEGTNVRFNLYVDGTLVRTQTTNGITNFVSVMDQLQRIILFPIHSAGSPRCAGSVHLHSYKVYNSHLVDPMLPIPTFTPPALPRTLLLMTFTDGIPADTTRASYNFNSSVWFANGGPSDLPYVRVTNQNIHLLDYYLQVGLNEEFTLEFDIRIVTPPSYNTIWLLSWPTKNSSQASAGVQLSASRGLTVSSGGGSSTGSLSLSANTWETLTIVRRFESPNYVTYFFRNGVGNLRLTTANVSGTSAYYISGSLIFAGDSSGSGHESVPNGLVFDLANIRLTRGVIEHFNPAGFTQPVGLRGVLT